MVRTQIYLTAEEQADLRTLAEKTGRKQSELIREALDSFLAHHAKDNRNARLRKASGLWQDRSDDAFREIRKEVSRRTGR